MLPYFGFPDPDEDQDQNVARANEQVIQARGALRHYHDLLKGPTLFDQLYLIGDFPFSMIDRHSKGSGDQRNPALFSEFLAASAGAAFFRRDRVDEEDVVPNEVLVSARENKNAIHWRDLPPIQQGEDDKARRALHESVSQFLRFAVAFKHWKSHFASSENRKRVASRGWYNRQGLPQVDWENASPSTALDNLERSIDHALRWFAMIQAYATRSQEAVFDLWRVSGVLDTPVLFDQPHRDPLIKDELTSREYSDLYVNVAQKYAQKKDADMPNTSTFADYLDGYEVENDHTSMARMIAALYSFSQVRPL